MENLTRTEGTTVLSGMISFPDAGSQGLSSIARALVAVFEWMLPVGSLNPPISPVAERAGKR
jgi:hypothetical protein